MAEYENPDLRKRTGIQVDQAPAAPVQEHYVGEQPKKTETHLSPPALAPPDESDSAQPSDEDEEEKPLNEKKMAELAKKLPAASDTTVSALDNALSVLSPRWRNWVVRGIFSLFMISGFAAIVYSGPLALMLLVLAIQIKCFQEIINIGHVIYRVHGLPWFRSLSWYLLVTSNYFFYGESYIDYGATALRKDEFLKFLVVHHRFISFALYIVGFVWFVLSLVKRYYMRQFSLFAWTHVTLLLIVTQSHLIIQNIFEGVIWFLVPVSMIICNDIMAYIFGFFFGRTPLIKLSPKKTWEGFIGGAISTVLFGMAMSYVMLQYNWFICPVDYYSEDNGNFSCQRPVAFQLQEYNLPRPLSFIFRLLRLPPKVGIYPMIFHSLVMALFASIIGPFGGFFASGFKRAFKIKDFGAVIPGHGGLMDRFDCQLLMGTFVNVYIHTFIRIPNPSKLLQQILFLRPEEQLAVFNLLQQKLISRGLLANTTAT